jgi:tetratricopeptide (TPR) repeat protein
LGLCQTYAASGDGAKAIDECKEALRLAPVDDQIAHFLGQLYLSEKRSREALSLFEPLAEKFRNRIAILGVLADAYMVEGDFTRAAGIYEQIVTLDPRIPLTYARLAEVYDKLGRVDDSLKSAQKTVELDPNNYASHLLLGKIRLEAGFFHESIAPLSKAIELRSDCGEAYGFLSEAYEIIGDKQNALGSAQHAFKYLTDDFGVAFRLGSVLMDYERFADAIKPFERSNELRPNHFEVIVRLGVAYVQANEFEKGIKTLEKAEAIKAGHLGVANFLRFARTRIQMIANFDNVYNFVQKNPGHLEARFALAATYRYRGMMKEALAEYQTAVKEHPENFDTYNRLAVHYSEMGETEKTLEFLRKAVTINPHHVLYMSIGRTLDRLGRLDEAIEALQKSVEIKSTLFESQMLLAELFDRRGKREETLKAYQNALAINAANPLVNEALVWYYIKTGNKDAALRYYDILKTIATSDLKFVTKCLRAHYGPIR